MRHSDDITRHLLKYQLIDLVFCVTSDSMFTVYFTFLFVNVLSTFVQTKVFENDDQEQRNIKLSIISCLFSEYR